MAWPAAQPPSKTAWSRLMLLASLKKLAGSGESALAAPNSRPARSARPLEREGSGDPEVAPTATHAPEEVRVLGRIGRELLSIGGHQLDREQTVDGKPMFPHQPADAPAQGESAHPCSR